MTQTTAGWRKPARPAVEAPVPTREQRVARGRAARMEVPRESHAEFARQSSRPDSLSLLESQSAARVPELLPVRYGRMAVSPFTYFRAAALPMASDLADSPRTGLVVQACGDAHLPNFGLFASSERRLVFDINDFDETLPGPWEWDVKRLATSLEIAGRDNEFSAKQRREIVVAAVAAYRRAMRSFAVTTALQVWYAIPDAAAVKAWFDTDLDKTHRKRLTRALDKARTKDNLGALSRYAGIVDGRPRIVADPPLVVPLDELVGEASQLGDVEQALRELLRSYRSSLEPERRALLDQYRLVDFALKVVGVGSMGTRSYIALLLSDDVRDPLFLQAKEAGPSGWKGSAEIGVMVPQGMRAYGELCGWTLARAHARTGDRVGIASYLGSGSAFDRAVGEFARSYADQNERDHRALVDAIGSGRIEAESGL